MINNHTGSGWYLFLFFGVLSVVVWYAGLAQATLAAGCGDILQPVEFYDEGEEGERYPIEDCDNPFGRTHTEQDFYINGEVAVDGASYVIGEDGTNDYGYLGENYFFRNFGEQYYLHVGPDYQTIINTEYEYPTEDEISRLIGEFLSEYPYLIPKYTTIFNDGYKYPYFYVDDETQYLENAIDNRPVEEIYYEMEAYIEENAKSYRPPLLPGTYTIVRTDTDEGPVLNYDNLLEKWFDAIIPTAYAYTNIHQVTFTLLAEEPVPTGASSVLFLPGIQASRLYTDGLLGSENQLWEPNINSDVQELEMTTEGVSVNDVYTREVVDEIFGIQNVYQSFLGMLQDMKEDEEIKDYLPFAYDWRYSVKDIVDNGTQYQTGAKNVIEEIETLALDKSFTDKVTIIAHSNGGLLAKQIMIELEERDLSHLVDKVVFVGTPQLGTPKAIGAILHGYGQKYGGGFISDDETARDVIRNMPGTYALLPSEKYFEVINEVVVSNDDSSSTAYLDEYNNIADFSSLQDFMTDSSDTRQDDTSINVPNTSNATLLTSARDLHRQLDNWIAPSSTKVFEIAGVGIPTIKGFDYKEFPCTSYMTGLPCAGGIYSKSYPVVTSYGDETVVASSAVAYRGDKFIAKVDLFEEGVGILEKRYEHANMTESPTIKQYLDSIIKFGYQNETLNIPEDYIEVEQRYTIAGVHSPVDVLLVDSDGNKIGEQNDEVFDEIPGAQYIELADSRYVIVPEGEYEVILSGYATGTFSVTMQTLRGDVTKTIGGVFGVSTTPEMTGTFVIDEETLGLISIDLDGDTLVDTSVDLTTGIMTPTPSESDVVIDVPRSKSSGTKVSKLPQPQVAGVSLSSDELYYQKMHELLVLIQAYISYLSKK